MNPALKRLSSIPKADSPLYEVWQDEFLYSIHVIPKKEDHDCSKSCWCHPELNYIDQETNRPVYLHKMVQ